jgi:methionyl-tRNA formyltransferase
MRIVVLTNDYLPANVITETLLREAPASVVGLVASATPERGVSKPIALWRQLHRWGPLWFATVARHSIQVRTLWRLRRMRGNSSLPPHLPELAARAAIPLIPTLDINSPETIAAVRALTPDLLVSIYFNQRLRRDVLAVAPRGAINLHPALLPQHRGPFPHFWVVAAGEKYTGVTVHWIDERIDTGDILQQRELPVPAAASVSAVMGMVARPGAISLVEAVRLIEAGVAPRHPQHGKAVYESWPTQRDLIRMWRRGGRYGSGAEVVAACERV